MKIFVVYAEAGSGHKKIAEGIYGKLNSCLDKSSVNIFDILDFTPSIFKKIYSKGYVLLISRLSWLWAVIFYLAETKWLSFVNVYLRNFLSIVFCRRFIDFMVKENPDAVISTHFLVNEVVSHIKQKHSVKAKLISMVTDYGVHRFWIAKNVDLYIAASLNTEQELIAKGVDKNRICVWGIPAREQFNRLLDKKELRRKLGAGEDSFCALIVTGGIGIGPIERIVRLFDDKLTIIVVCGTNQKLTQRLQRINFQNLKVFGWVDKIEELMAASDVVLTKPGGSTISECLFLNLPMIFFSVIPGQEANNARIMRRFGACEILESPEAIKDFVLSLSENPDQINYFKGNISRIRKSDFYDNLIRWLNENC